MKKRMRVLIADDDVIFRNFLRGCLENIDNVEVLAAAVDGRDTLRKIKALKPDVVTLDMQMPHITGIDILESLQETAPQTAVLVIASELECDAARAVEALEAGAYDFIMKSACLEKNPKQVLMKELQLKLPLARGIATVVQKTPARRKLIAKRTTKPPRLNNRPDILAIGSSTGGPVALHNVLKMLPASFPIPITVTQHMPKTFLPSLAARLDKDTALKCVLAEDGMVLEAGCIYVAPGDIHMEIEHVGGKLRVHLVEGERVNHCIPAVDVTFHSLAALMPRVYSMAVVLTGMGNDGSVGAKALADKKLTVIAQDEASSVVWGMPGETVRLGAASEVLPLANIAAAIVKICGGER